MDEQKAIEAMDRAKEKVEQLRREREVSPEKLHKPYDI
jgi:hypothetical protein